MESQPWFRMLAETRVSRGLAALAILGVMVVSMAVGSAIHLSMLLRAAERRAAAHPISVSSDRLDFGDVPYHGTVIRHLVLRNDGDDAVRAWFFASGRGYTVEPRDLILEPGIATKVAVTASAFEPGPMSGELLVQVGDGGGPLVIPLAASSGSGEDPQGAASAALEARLL